MTDELLIVFCKNPVLGKVKSRLARDIGEKAALEVYLRLLENARKNVADIPFDIQVAYSDFIDTEDQWENDRFLKTVQRGADLGERMRNALEDAFAAGRKKVCLVGVDIPRLDGAIIRSAFSALDRNRAVVGPAKDGGYYLIGFSLPLPDMGKVFEGKEWGGASVYSDTMDTFKELGVEAATLTVLGDIDGKEDLKEF